MPAQIRPGAAAKPPLATSRSAARAGASPLSVEYIDLEVTSPTLGGAHGLARGGSAGSSDYELFGACDYDGSGEAAAAAASAGTLAVSVDRAAERDDMPSYVARHRDRAVTWATDGKGDSVR